MTVTIWLPRPRRSTDGDPCPGAATSTKAGSPGTLSWTMPSERQHVDRRTERGVGEGTSKAT